MILLYKVIKGKDICPEQYVLMYKDLSSSMVYIRWIHFAIKKKLSRRMVKQCLVHEDSTPVAKQLSEGYKIYNNIATYSLVWKYKL